MDIYVASQPIFNRRQNVIGCELTYHSGLVSGYGGGEMAKLPEKKVLLIMRVEI
jgi:c-di-GMP-related signal transduction protein